MGEPLMKIRKLDSTEISDVLNLALRVFLEFEGPVYSVEGIAASSGTRRPWAN